MRERKVIAGGELGRAATGQTNIVKGSLWESRGRFQHCNRRERPCATQPRLLSFNHGQCFLPRFSVRTLLIATFLLCVSFAIVALNYRSNLRISRLAESKGAAVAYWCEFEWHDDDWSSWSRSEVDPWMVRYKLAPFFSRVVMIFGLPETSLTESELAVLENHWHLKSVSFVSDESSTELSRSAIEHRLDGVHVEFHMSWP